MQKNPLPRLDLPPECRWLIDRKWWTLKPRNWERGSMHLIRFINGALFEYRLFVKTFGMLLSIVWSSLFANCWRIIHEKQNVMSSICKEYFV